MNSIGQRNAILPFRRRDWKKADRQSMRWLASTLETHLRLQYALCCQLEALADSLPGNVDRQECLVMARSIVAVMRRSHAFEEDVLFPAIDRGMVASPTLERLRYEHWEDESYAGEISESLMRLVTEPDSLNPDTLAYMLRGFFEGLRRHIAFEREHLLPLISVGWTR